MTDVLGLYSDDEDVPEATGTCPRCDCGGDLEVREEIADGAYDVECSDCDYWEHIDEVNDIPARPEGLLEHVINVAARFTHPYTHVVYWGTILAILAITLYAGQSPGINDWTGFLLVPLVLLFSPVRSPDTYCPSCNRRVSPPDAGDDLTASGFCANCGEYYSSPLTYVDTNRTPVYSRLWSRATDRFPEWVEFSTVSIIIRTERGNKLLDRIIGSRQSLWLRILDVGILIFAGIYAALLAVLIDSALKLPTALSTFTFTAPEFSNAPADAASSTLTVSLVAEIALLLAQLFAAFWLPFSVGMVIAVLIHELGHGVALRLHGHDVEEFGASFLFGVIPNYAYTEPGLAADENRSLRAALHLDTGGVLFNVITGLPLALLLVYDVQSPVFGVTGLDNLLVGYIIGTGAAPINALPVFGLDGQRFQDHLVYWVSDNTLPTMEDILLWGTRVTGLVVVVAGVLGLLLI